MDIRTLCLGVLTAGESSGYEIKKALQEEFGLFMEVSHSSIYPALGELLQEGLVSCTEVRQEGKPDKKVYRLTEPGRQAFIEGLVRSPARHRLRSEFLTVLVFSQFLPPQRLRQILDERTEEFRQHRRQAMECLHDPSAALPAGARFAAGLGDVALKAIIDYIETNRGWLEEAAGTELQSHEETR
jgi:PadR family transcriptional regulator AphA